MNQPTKPNPLKFSLADLCVLIVLAACTTLILAAAFRANFSPMEFAESLDYESASLVLIVFSFGIIGFPVLLTVGGFLISRKTQLYLRDLLAWYLFTWAVLSVPLAIAIARACAGALA